MIKKKKSIFRAQLYIYDGVFTGMCAIIKSYDKSKKSSSISNDISDAALILTLIELFYFKAKTVKKVCAIRLCINQL